MSPTVICLGECLMDRLFDRYDPAHSKSQCWVDYPGGAPANVATGLAKLGTSAAFIGCIGDDDHGNALIRSLRRLGVNCDYMQRSQYAPTRVVLVQRNSQGERQFVGFSRSNPEDFADVLLSPQALPQAWFESASYWVTGTLGLAYPAFRSSIEQALTWAEQSSTKTIVDVNWRPMFWPDPALAPDLIQALLAQVDIVKLSEEEADWLFKTTDAAAILQSLQQPQVVLVTSGAAGCAYATPTGQGKFPAFDVDCEDTTGAGDAFLAGFIHRLLQLGPETLEDGQWLADSIQFASAVGALTTTRAGAMVAQPTAQEVEAFLYLQTQQESS
jgi:fructokinase